MLFFGMFIGYENLLWYCLRYRTIYVAIKVLRKVGFVRVRYDEGPPVRRFISLTEKGREVAKHAVEILKLAGIV